MTERWRRDAGPLWVNGDNEAVVTLRVEIDNIIGPPDRAGTQ